METRKREEDDDGPARKKARIDEPVEASAVIAAPITIAAAVLKEQAPASTPAELGVTVKFDPHVAMQRLAKFWQLDAEFGYARDHRHVYLDEIVSDRFALVNGLQLIRDELQLAGHRTSGSRDASDEASCGADFSLPSVVTTLAHTNCGDRVQGEAMFYYKNLVAQRFASMSSMGEILLESFTPTGGGTEDGATLAHVTHAHMIDDNLKSKVYGGHAASFLLVNIDLMTHVGLLRDHKSHSCLQFGMVQESPWREPRTACGAIVGCLNKYSDANSVFRRLKDDLGQENFDYLSTTKVMSDDGACEITYVIAAAIVAVRGMLNTLGGLEKDLDERGMGHCTATTTVNVSADQDQLIYLARGIVFNGTRTVQGFGTDARKYSGVLMKRHEHEPRLRLAYDGMCLSGFPMSSSSYTVRKAGGAAAK